MAFLAFSMVCAFEILKCDHSYLGIYLFFLENQIWTLASFKNRISYVTKKKGELDTQRQRQVTGSFNRVLAQLQQ